MSLDGHVQTLHQETCTKTESLSCSYAGCYDICTMKYRSRPLYVALVLCCPKRCLVGACFVGTGTIKVCAWANNHSIAVFIVALSLISLMVPLVNDVVDDPRRRRARAQRMRHHRVGRMHRHWADRQWCVVVSLAVW